MCFVNVPVVLASLLIGYTGLHCRRWLETEFEVHVRVGDPTTFTFKRGAV